MRISELSATTGVPIATVKYYIREGMLPRGDAQRANQSDYTHEHVTRLRLIRALADVGQLPLTRIRQILTLIDEPGKIRRTAITEAVDALLPDAPAREDYPLARATLDRLGYAYDPTFTATARLEMAIHAVLDAGMPWDDEIIDAYGPAVFAIADCDIRRLSACPQEQIVPSGILTVAMYEPVIVALRRVAHIHALDHRDD